MMDPGGPAGNGPGLGSPAPPPSEGRPPSTIPRGTRLSPEPEAPAVTVPSNRLSLRVHDRPHAAIPEPILCIVGETLCRVQVWTDEEWERLDPSKRPAYV